MDSLLRVLSRLLDTPLAQFALLVTILVGLFTIGEKVLEIAMGAYHQLRAWSHWPTDRKVLHFLKSNDHGVLHEVKEIAEALGKKQRTVAESLRRLAQREKAEQKSNLWGLHDLEE